MVKSGQTRRVGVRMWVPRGRRKCRDLHRCREWKRRQQQGKEGVGVNGESSTDVYARSCVRQMAGGQLLCDPGRPAGHSVMT